MIPKNAKNPSGAWEFIKFVLQTQEQQKYSALGYSPVRSDVLTPALNKQYPFEAVALHALANGYCPDSIGFNTIFVAPNGPTWTLFQRAVFHGDIGGALKQGQTDLQNALQQFGDAS